MMEKKAADADELTKLSLTYPTKNGTVTRDLNTSKVEVGGDEGWVDLRYSPWKEDGQTDTSVMNITVIMIQ